MCCLSKMVLAGEPCMPGRDAYAFVVKPMLMHGPGSSARPARECVQQAAPGKIACVPCRRVLHGPHACACVHACPGFHAEAALVHAAHCGLPGTPAAGMRHAVPAWDADRSAHHVLMCLAGCIPVFIGPPWHALPLGHVIDWGSVALFFKISGPRPWLRQDEAWKLELPMQPPPESNQTPLTFIQVWDV